MSPIKRVVIAGGSGFIGQSLARHLAQHGYEIVILSRNSGPEESRWTYVHWDGRTIADWSRHLDGAAALVNLAGRSIDCIKSPDHLDEILRSRVESTEALGGAMRAIENPPPVWIQMSTAHIYGDPGPEISCDESSAFGYGTAPNIGRAWENAYRQSVLPQTRQVIARTSFVLGRNGGALERLASLARWGLGGTIGHGRQGMSWIHEYDLNQFILRAIQDPMMKGEYLTTAPNPVSNSEFMRELRRSLGVPIGIPAAAWMVRIAAPLFLKTDPELALYGRYCFSNRLRDEGFSFKFSELGPALADLCC